MSGRGHGVRAYAAVWWKREGLGDPYGVSVQVSRSWFVNLSVRRSWPYVRVMFWKWR
jgi:hypothetical protein